jgi:DNA invertase Pin-like site-specific DNA recombinase
MDGGMGMIYGYARVSTIEQNEARQIKQLREAGCEKIYCDKTSGATTERQELKRLLDALHPGDVIIVSDLTRFSRSTRDLFELMDLIKSKGAALKSIKDTWLDTTSDNPYATFLLTVMAGVAQLERDLIKQRQAEGVILAKEAGKYKGRLKKYTDKHQGMRHAVELYKSGQYTVRQICAITHVSRSALYRELQTRKTV